MEAGPIGTQLYVIFLIHAFAAFQQTMTPSSRSGWTKIEQMHENVHSNLALELLFESPGSGMLEEFFRLEVKIFRMLIY